MRKLAFILVILISTEAQAQLDSSSGLLFRSSAQTLAPEDLDTERYHIREMPIGQDDSGVVPVARPKGAAKAKKSVVKPARKVASQDATDSKKEVSADTNPVAPQSANTAKEKETSMKEQLAELLLGGNHEEIEEYKKQTHPEDPRVNILSIDLAPSYFHLDSSSAYHFRNYNSNGPGLNLGMNFWVTPFFGIQTRYLASVGASVNSNGNAVPMHLQDLDVGIRFRKFFGSSRKSTQLSWGLDFEDASAKISRDATSVVGRRTHGPSLNVEARIPLTNTYASLIEVSVQPRAKHTELSTGVAAASGTQNQTDAVALRVGGDWVLDRKNQMFWQLNYKVERNLFQGTASQADLITGQTPSGVSVTNSVLFFSVGFRWGS
jgi:hypothetical protein